MSATLIVVRDPFHPQLHREVHAVQAGRTLADIAPKLTNKPFYLVVNGLAVLRKDWDSTTLKPGDVVAAIFLLEGDDSNPLQIVLMVAVMYFAPYLAEAMLGTEVAAYSLSAVGMSSQTFVSLATAGISMAGNALINAAFGTPKAPSNQLAAAAASPSPTYNLQAQGNMARIDAAIPVQYGRLCCYPDFASQPYVEYAGNEQYLYSLLCVGAGEYDIEQIRIEDTPISNWPEITTETIGPHGTVTLFPANVDTSAEVSGQEMTYDVWLGPFTANAAETNAGTLGLDFVFSRGLYSVNTDSGALMEVGVNWSVEARQIDDVGLPVGAGTWSALGTETYSAATTTPQRLSKRYNVTPARYEVRVKRTSTESTANTVGDKIAWAGLRAYLPDTRDFGDVTLIAIRARATNNLSMQASRKINVIATRKIQAWNGTTFGAAAASSSIAWALADMCRDSVNGAGLPNARIDLAGLLALDAIWTARGDQFNGRFDNTISFWEALTKVARAGRALPFMQGGIIRFARDQAQTTPVALFSMRNITKGSFGVQYLTPSEAMADAIDVSYFDDAVWAQRRVQAKLAGSTAAKPVKIDLFGVTDRDQAFREGIYEAACNRYRRKMIKFTTSMEGFIPSFSDLIAIAHDMPQWGQTAESTAWDSVTRTLTVTEPLTFTEGATHYVGLRKRNGGVDGPYAVTAGATANQIILSEPPTFTPYTGGNEERTHIVFGPGETWRQPARVLAVKPRGLELIDIECVNEDPSVHTAETGQIAPAVQYGQLPTRWTAPIVEGLVAWSMPNAPEQMVLSWRPAAGAEHYLIEQSSDAATWTRTGETRAANFTAIAIYGSSTIVRLAAVGLTRGPWVTIGYGGLADYMWNAVDTTPMWNATDSTPMWRY